MLTMSRGVVPRPNQCVGQWSEGDVVIMVGGRVEEDLTSTLTPTLTLALTLALTPTFTPTLTLPPQIQGE